MMSLRGPQIALWKSSESRGPAIAEPRDLAELQLERACGRSSGYLLVTGSNQREITQILHRVLSRVGSYATVHARAAAGPAVVLERLLSASESGEAEGDADASRAVRLKALIARAKAQGRDVFVVVEDGDDASIEQLDRLRASLEVVPDAIETLRLVLLGSSRLADKLAGNKARGITSRIVARVRLDVDAHDKASASSTWAISAAALSLALIAYGGGHVLSGDSKRNPAAEAERFRADALRTFGSASFLRAKLEIPIETAWVTGSALYPPPVPEPPTATELVAPTSLPPVVARAPLTPDQYKPKPPVAKASPERAPTARLKDESSIAVLMRRFP